LKVYHWDDKLTEERLGYLIEAVEACLEESEQELDKVITQGDPLPDTLDEGIDVATGAGARVAMFKQIHEELTYLKEHPCDKCS
jgi:hypothetical protein